MSREYLVWLFMVDQILRTAEREFTATFLTNSAREISEIRRRRAWVRKKICSFPSETQDDVRSSIDEWRDQMHVSLTEELNQTGKEGQ